MPAALVALGSNLGSRETTLEQAAARLRARAGHGELRVSRWYRSQPIGGPAGQPPFLNGAVLFETTLAPLALLAELQVIERELGRERHERWDARTIDLDLLLYGEAVLELPELVVPHPRMAYRRFVVEPAAEIAGAMRHPTLDCTMAELRTHLRDAPPYVTISAAEHGSAVRLAEELARATGAARLALPVSPARSAKSAGPGSQESATLEFLRTCAVQSAPHNEGGAAELVIGDYWFEDIQADARRELSGAALSELDTLRPAVVPKLLLWLESPAHPFRQPARLPAVRALASDWARALEEATAAIAAMQSSVGV